MSIACSSGTPAFIMVASWRVKMAMSFGLIFWPERFRRFLILPGVIPCRRRNDITWCSPPARVSPRTGLPLRSRPSHSKTNSVIFAAAAVAMTTPLSPHRSDGLHIGAAQHLFERGDAELHSPHACLAPRSHALGLGLLRDVEHTTSGEDQPLDVLADRHDLVQA